MQNDQISGRTADAHPSVSEIRAELRKKFTWPGWAESSKQPLVDLAAVLDLDHLKDISSRSVVNNELGFTIFSKEYIKTGLNWVWAMRRIGLTNYIIVAGDQETSDVLTSHDILHVTLNDANISGVDDQKGVSGYTAKGLAMLALKYPVARFLVQQGHSAVFSDADAIWLQDPMPYMRDVDVAFQRIASFPAHVSQIWGFGACAGFVSFRHGIGTLKLLDRLIEEHSSLQDCQVALNLCLLDGAPVWTTEPAHGEPSGEGPSTVHADGGKNFVRDAKLTFYGALNDGALTAIALPHDKFWRNDIVKANVSGMVLCHPNSPKDDAGKIWAFDKLGINFHKAAA